MKKTNDGQSHPNEETNIPEPGEFIATGDCPICGSTITVEHGDDPGEIAFLAHSNQQGRDLASVYRRALERIVLKEGPFSRDQLRHAENTIDAMADIAKRALAGEEIPDE